MGQGAKAGGREGTAGVGWGLEGGREVGVGRGKDGRGGRGRGREGVLWGITLALQLTWSSIVCLCHQSLGRFCVRQKIAGTEIGAKRESLSCDLLVIDVSRCPNARGPVPGKFRLASK